MKTHTLTQATLIGLLSLAGSSLVWAGNDRVYSGWSWGVNIDQLHISSDVANRPDIQLGTTANAFGISAEHFSSDTDMTYTIGVDFISYNDNNPFYYEHDSGRYEQSRADSYLIYGEAGPKIRFGMDDMSFFNVKLGYSDTVGSSRYVDCGCYSKAEIVRRLVWCNRHWSQLW